MAQITQTDIHKAKEKLALYLKRWKDYPLGFVMEALQGYRYGPPLPFQIDIMNDVRDKRFVAVASGRGPGKTRAVAIIVWWFVICMKRPGQPLKIPITSPAFGNVTDVIWSEIALLQTHLLPWLRSRFVLNAEGGYCIEDKAWFMSPRTARKENSDAMAGFHGDTLTVADEASGIPEEILTVIEGSLTDENCYMLMPSNPRRLNGFFFDAFHDEKSYWALHHINCEEQLSSREFTYEYINPLGESEIITVNGRVSPSWLQNMKNKYGEESAVYSVEVLGEFPTSEEDQLIKTQWVQHAFKNERKNVTDRHRLMGCDIAWDGSDHSAIVVRHGPNIEEIETWHGNDPTESADRIAARFEELADAGKPVRYICVDSIGIGAGVYSDLLKKNYPVLRVEAYNKAPLDGGTKCWRLRDYLWWRARLFFKDQNPHFCENSELFKRLAEELCMPLFKYDVGNMVKVEKKDDMRKRLRRSPDVADALNLTFFADWTIRSTDHHRRKQKGRQNHQAKTRSADPARWKTL